jgi:hypothetical protein
MSSEDRSKGEGCGELMSGMSDRLRSRVARDFDESGSAQEIIKRVEGASDSERTQAAIIFATHRDVREIERGIALSTLDWRDVLVNGGLADEDWRAVLDDALGSS